MVRPLCDSKFPGRFTKCVIALDGKDAGDSSERYPSTAMLELGGVYQCVWLPFEAAPMHGWVPMEARSQTSAS